MIPLAIPLAALLGAAPSAAALQPASSPTLGVLRDQALRAPAAAYSGDEAKRQSGEEFDGFGSVKVLRPVDYVDVPGEDLNGKRTTLAPPQTAPDPEEKGSGEVPLGDSYTFNGRRTAIPSLTIYTPEKEAPGADGSTDTPGESGWREWLPTALAVGGAAATVGGLFFPPLLFLGGLLLGGFAMWKLMGG